MKKRREAWIKKLDDIPSYYSSRADAIDKLGLPKATKSETKTQTSTESIGGKDGDEKKSSTTIVSEEKNDAGAMDQTKYFRTMHLISIDVQCYTSLYMNSIDFLNDYISILYLSTICIFWVYAYLYLIKKNNKWCYFYIK